MFLNIFSVYYFLINFSTYYRGFWFVISNHYIIPFVPVSLFMLFIPFIDLIFVCKLVCYLVSCLYFQMLVFHAWSFREFFSGLWPLFLPLPVFFVVLASEFFSYLSRPYSTVFRPIFNLSVGVLVLGGFVSLFSFPLEYVLQLVIMSYEILVCCIQAVVIVVIIDFTCFIFLQ